MSHEEYKDWIKDYEVPFQLEMLVCLAPCAAFVIYLFAVLS